MAIHNVFVLSFILLSAILPLVHLIDPCKYYVCGSFQVCQIKENSEPYCSCLRFLCTDEYMPVCASDGRTYDNECFMNSASCDAQRQLHVVMRGKCTKPEPPGTPQITGFPSGPVLTGTQLNLKCVAFTSGDTYDWYKDGTKVSTSLTYDFQVTKESAGVYRCEARNDGGSATSSDKTLVVYYKADSVVVSSGKTSSHVGETDKFTCTVTGGSPTPNLKIYLKEPGGTPVAVTQGQDRVMAKEDNQAEYYCEAKVTGYPALDMTSSRKTYNVTWSANELKMTEKPSAPMSAGVGISVKCETDSSNSGSPDTISWYKNGQQIISGVTPSIRLASDRGIIYISQLTFTARKEDNQAKYECKINDQASFRKDVTITVNFPPIVQSVSSVPKTVKEGDTVTLTCEASGGNPTVYTYIWYYNSKQIPNVNSRHYRISSIQYDKSGEYRCRVVNYSPGGIADASLKIDVLYKAKWDPKQPTALAVASKSNASVMLTLRIIAKPRPTDITWFHPNHEIATGENFIPAEVNGTYTLSKGTVTSRDYGNYTVKVTNSVGISSFVFELVRTAPSVPTFTITRNGKLVTVAFGPLIKGYTGFQLRFCEPGQAPKTTGCSRAFFLTRDPAKTNYTIQVTHETTIYVFYLDFYDGDDIVYSSGRVQSIPVGSESISGMVAGVVVAIVILVAVVVVVVVVVLHRRNMACFSGPIKSEGANQDDEKTGTTPPQSDVLHDTCYMNVDNRAFEVVYDNTQLTKRPSGENAALEVEGGVENPYDEMKNPYADLNITADVIADQTYAELK